MVVLVVIPGEEPLAEGSGIFDRPEAVREVRPIFQRLECGLSLLVCGRLCVLVTPRLARRKATGFEVIAEPRSAWMVSWPCRILCLRTVSSISCCATWRLWTNRVLRAGTAPPVHHTYTGQPRRGCGPCTQLCTFFSRA